MELSTHPAAGGRPAKARCPAARRNSPCHHAKTFIHPTGIFHRARRGNWRSGMSDRFFRAAIHQPSASSCAAKISSVPNDKGVWRDSTSRGGPRFVPLNKRSADLPIGSLRRKWESSRSGDRRSGSCRIGKRGGSLLQSEKPLLLSSSGGERVLWLRLRRAAVFARISQLTRETAPHPNLL